MDSVTGEKVFGLGCLDPEFADQRQGREKILFGNSERCGGGRELRFGSEDVRTSSEQIGRNSDRHYGLE